MRRLLPLLLVACAPTDVTKDLGLDETDAGDSDLPDTDLPDTDDTDAEAVDTALVTLDDTADTDLFGDTGPFGQVVIEVTGTADDGWELFVDGQAIPLDATALDWRQMTTQTFTMPGQRHVLAIRAWDAQRVITGFIATVYVNGEKMAVTGDDRFRFTPDRPDPSWIDRRFDDAAWSTGGACTAADAAVWGTGVAGVKDLLDDGAQWMWAGPCRRLGETWLRLRVGPTW